MSSALAEAIRAGVLEEHGQRLRIRHDLLREAVYEDLPASVRLALHGEAGRRLARADAPALQVAEQLARGATAGDPEAVGWLTRAAREAAARSPAIAAELLGRAASLAGPADPGRDRLLVERAGALLQAGAIDEAAVLCRALLDRDHDPAAEGSARLALGRALVEAALRRLGVRRGARGPRRRPALGWGSLTPTERRVVDLVAEGLSNPQIGERLFISRRIVQTHLAHVFAKLGLSSRTQLAAEAARRRQTTPTA